MQVSMLLLSRSLPESSSLNAGRNRSASALRVRTMANISSMLPVGVGTWGLMEVGNGHACLPSTRSRRQVAQLFGLLLLKFSLAKERG